MSDQLPFTATRIGYVSRGRHRGGGTGNPPRSAAALVKRLAALELEHVQVQVIEGANHGYENREPALFLVD